MFLMPPPPLRCNPALAAGSAAVRIPLSCTDMTEVSTHTYASLDAQGALQKLARQALEHATSVVVPVHVQGRSVFERCRGLFSAGVNPLSGT